MKVYEIEYDTFKNDKIKHIIYENVEIKSLNEDELVFVKLKNGVTVIKKFEFDYIFNLMITEVSDE